ncbi:hypothetical protein C8R44DRAFT_894745 [Mycena epipterygia]|nr:hypothetical protein C8R44DRAFT_894745 [Mycena epipterygia]
MQSFLLPALLLALTGAISGNVIPRDSGLVPAIFYSPNGAVGACGVAIQNSDFAIALNTVDFGAGANCGKETFVTFEGATITAIVVDICTECAPGGVKLTTGVEALTGTTGTIDVTWHIKVFPPPVDITGLASSYTPTQGACTGNPIASTDFSIALSDADLEGGVTCGKTVDITFDGTTITTTVQDFCSDCATGEIKMTSSAFAALTGSDSAESVEVVWFIETVGV